MEYGGFIELEYFQGKEYHSTAVALNSGRHCLEYLIRAKNIQKIHIPYFLCDSVPNLCQKLGVGVAYYHIDTTFVPRFDCKLNSDEWLYVVNFYGQLSDEMLLKLKNRFRNVIVDNAQAFFRKPLPGVDTCYTCRKFFGVPDGGYLYTATFLEEHLETDISYDRIGFLMGRLELGANPFYSQYVENNKLFANEPLKRMSKLTQNLLRGIDYGRAEQIRTENFVYLHEQLRGYNKLNLTVPQGAFMYPLYLENGAEIRKTLQQRKIYIPTLWPYVFHVCAEDTLEWDMAKNILPIPVDQRYGREDMDALISEITACIV